VPADQVDAITAELVRLSAGELEAPPAGLAVRYRYPETAEAVAGAVAEALAGR
jgi:hypothetical protein